RAGHAADQDHRPAGQYGAALLLRLRWRRLRGVLLVPGRARRRARRLRAAAPPRQGELLSAVGSMNHVAFHVPSEKFDSYRQRLIDKGVEVSPVLNHDDSKYQVAAEVHPGVFVRSVYFQDPYGILLEFACWMREFTDADVSHAPKTAADRTCAKEPDAALA